MTPRGFAGARSRPLSSAGARQLRPEVGVQAASVALGGIRAGWQGGSNRPFSHMTPPPKARVEDPTRPYHVGKSRAKEQLKIALSTHDKETQLRRLEQALESNRYTRSRDVGAAQEQARVLSRVVAGKRPATSSGVPSKAQQSDASEDFRPATAPAPFRSEAVSENGIDDDAPKTEAMYPDDDEGDDQEFDDEADEDFGEEGDEDFGED